MGMLMMNLFQLAIKYAIVGVAVALAAVAIPNRSLNSTEISGLAASGAMTFLILDMFAPNIGMGARQGAGFSIGSKLVGGNGLGAVSPLLEGMGEDDEYDM